MGYPVFMSALVRRHAFPVQSVDFLHHCFVFLLHGERRVLQIVSLLLRLLQHLLPAKQKPVQQQRRIPNECGEIFTFLSAQNVRLYSRNVNMQLNSNVQRLRPVHYDHIRSASAPPSFPSCDFCHPLQGFYQQFLMSAASEGLSHLGPTLPTMQLALAPH